MLKKFNLRALVTTQKLDRLMVAAPNIGFSFQPSKLDTTLPRPAESDHIIDKGPEQVLMNIPQGRSAQPDILPQHIVVLLFISTTSAASMAISVPAPDGNSDVRLVRAGASLIPSPTMATFPFLERARMTLSFLPARRPR